MFCYVRDQKDNAWETLSEQERDAKTEEFVNENFAKEYAGQELDAGQYEVLRKSLIRIGKRTVQKLQAMMDASYKPRYFEYAFRKKLQVGDEQLSLVGVVDRGDLYVNEAEQTISLRVIDYKSGAHEFDLGDLYEGLELQLAIYTDVMRELVDQEWNKNRAETERYKIVTDSMYYYHMQDPYVQAENETEAEEAREKQLIYKGLARDDAEEFDTVLAYAEYKASALATQMKSGVIDKNPMRESNKTACDYCAYKDVCRFDEKYGNNRYHHTKHSAKEKEQLLEEMHSVCHGQKNRNR